MTFYEKELHRLFDDSERISDDTVFAGKTMITKIGKDLRAKVQFVNTKISGQYDALRLTIINRHEGTVDSETLKFSDIIGMKGDRTPHVWDDGDNERLDILNTVIHFIKVQKSDEIDTVFLLPTFDADDGGVLEYYKAMTDKDAYKAYFKKECGRLRAQYTKNERQQAELNADDGDESNNYNNYEDDKEPLVERDFEG